MPRVPGGSAVARRAQPRGGRGSRGSRTGGPRSHKTRAMAIGAVAGAGMLGLVAGAPAAARGPLRSSALAGARPPAPAELSVAADRASGPTVAAAPSEGRFSLAWSVQLRGATIAQSSPIVATLEGGPAVVVGALNGRVYAFSLATGRLLPGWPATDPGAVPIQATPSVNTSGGHTTIYIGTGDAGHPTPGGYLALNGNG